MIFTGESNGQNTESWLRFKYSLNSGQWTRLQSPQSYYHRYILDANVLDKRLHTSFVALCETRWEENHASVIALVELLTAIYKTLANVGPGEMCKSTNWHEQSVAADRLHMPLDRFRRRCSSRQISNFWGCDCEWKDCCPNFPKLARKVFVRQIYSHKDHEDLCLSIYFPRWV